DENVARADPTLVGGGGRNFWERVDDAVDQLLSVPLELGDDLKHPPDRSDCARREFVEVGQPGRGRGGSLHPHASRRDGLLSCARMLRASASASVGGT